MQRQIIGSFVCLLLLPAAVMFAEIREVGPGKTYRTPCDAIRSARAGDVIEIDAGGSYDGDVCAWTTDRLTLRGRGGRARINAAGGNSEGKGIWVIRGDDTVVENIEFTGARARDKNGAGIRLEGDNLTVRNCHFHHNEEGILSGAGGVVLIEHSEFGYNGHPNGQSHNLYIGAASKLIFRFNYSHNSTGGHLLKSRAAENHILYNRLSSENGDGSFEVDLPRGGRSFLIGNLLQQGAANVNGHIVAFRTESQNPPDAITELWAVNNTFVNLRPDFAQAFLTWPEVASRIHLRNNLYVGFGAWGVPNGGPAEGNIQVERPEFVDVNNLDFRILETSPAVDAGVAPGKAGEFDLTPAYSYVHPACGAVRRQQGTIDSGAYETGELEEMDGQPERCHDISLEPQYGAVNAAGYIPGPLTQGAIISVFGPDLATFSIQAGSIPLPLSVENLVLELNGQPLRLFYVSPSQINAQLPAVLLPGLYTLVLLRESDPGPTMLVDIRETAPQIFVYPGTGRAIAQNQDWSLNGPDSPAYPGEYITVYVNGIGALTYLVPSGIPSYAEPLSRCSLPHSATIGGLTAEVAFLGLTPGLIGVGQANIAVPGLPPGDHPVVLTIGDTNSNAPLVSVAN